MTKHRSMFPAVAVGMALLLTLFFVFGPHKRPPAPATARLGADCAANTHAGDQDTSAYRDLLGFASELTKRDPRFFPEPAQIWDYLGAEEVHRRVDLMKAYGMELNTPPGDRTTITLVGWPGWIAAISPGLYAHEKDTYSVDLYLEDPIATTGPTPSQRQDSLRDLEVCCVGTQDAHTLSVGQHVVFCVPLWEVDGARTSVQSRAVINPLEHRDLTTSAAVPADFRLHYEEHGCAQGYACPDFSVDIDSSGAVTYRGKSSVPVTGTVERKADATKLKELVQIIDRARLFSNAAYPSPPAAQTDGSTFISVTMNGKARSIAWSWDDVIPRTARLLATKTHEVAEVWPSIRLWPELDP